MGTEPAAWGIVGAVVAVLLAWPASAQEAPTGPCSPYRTADGDDIPSELPGCARRPRPAPGSLADELEFRRASKADEPDGDDPSRARRRTRRPR